MSRLDRERRLPRRGQRDGFLYVSILFTSLVVSITVAASLTLSMSHARRTGDRRDAQAAFRLAESEIQIQAARMNQSTDWRASSNTGEFSNWRLLESGRVRHRLDDPDGSLTDDLFDSVTLTVHAQVRNAEATLAVELQNDPKAHDVLRYAVTAFDDIEIEDGSVLSTEVPVQAVDDCKTSSTGRLVTPRLERGGAVNVWVNGDVAAANVTPLAQNVVSYYQNLGTEISRQSLRLSQGSRIIENVVLSPANNPYGTPNPEGIYWINPSPRPLVIRNCRIEGTLVVLGNNDVMVRGGVVWNSLDPGKPALLAAGEIRFESIASQLSEASINANLNPAPTPNRRGQSNSTMSDTYSTQFGGIYYTTSNIVVEDLASGHHVPFLGCLIGNDVIFECRTAIAFDPRLGMPPPDGFRDPIPMRFTSGTYRRLITPAP